MSDNIDIVDRLEDLILLALESSKFTLGKEKCVLKGKDCSMFEADVGSVLNFKDKSASSFYTSQIGGDEDDRLVATGPEYLLDHPGEIIGDEKQVVFFFGDVLRLIILKRTKRPLRNVFAIGGIASHWYEYHYREVRIDGGGRYGQRVIPFDKNGTPLMARFKNQIMSDPLCEGISAIACCSVIEDAHRSGTMLCTVSDETEIKFPVPLDDYQRIFSSRESPLLSSGKKKAIIHWVASHLRKSPSGEYSKVKKHVRGIRDFEIDGLKISISENFSHQRAIRANLKPVAAINKT